MTDETPTPNVPAAVVCPVEGCHALVPDTLEDRREHRAGHRQDKKVGEAIRRAIRELRGDFDTLRGETRDAVKRISDEVAGIDRAVGQIEIPEQTPPMQINRGTWEDDDDDEDGTTDHSDPWTDFATPAPTAASTDYDEDDEDDPLPQSPTVAAYPAIDRDDLTPGVYS